MKRKFKMSIPPRYILAILSGLCVILIFLSFRYKDTFQPMKTVVGRVMTPMQKGINEIGSFIHSKSELLASIEDLNEENKELKDKLGTISAENQLLQQDKYELETYRKLYKLDQQYSDYPKVGAQVIGRNADNWYSAITINKGSRDGLKVDMNVIAGEGLVGIITEVGYNYSTVRLIVDDNSNVNGMFLKTGDTCNVNGNLELLDSGLISLELIKKDAQVEVGYNVVTSHISNKFLPGILIGYVESISTDPTNLTMTGYLRPAVDFSNLDIVLVITELKEPKLKKDPNAKEDTSKDDVKSSPTPTPTTTPAP